MSDTTMTPEQCFDAMAEVLGFENPKDTGYMDILEKIKELKKKVEDFSLRDTIMGGAIKRLQKQNDFLRDEEQIEDFGEILNDFRLDSAEDIREELDDYKLFCDAFDVDCARDAIRIHWKNLSECCQEELTEKGFGPKVNNNA